MTTELQEMARQLRDLHQTLGHRVSVEGRLGGVEAQVAAVAQGIQELRRLMETASTTRETQGRELVELLAQHHGYVQRLGELEEAVGRIGGEVSMIKGQVGELSSLARLLRWVIGGAAALVGTVLAGWATGWLAG